MDHCPSDEQLQGAIDERQSGDEQTAVEAHLERCPSCQERLALLTDDDTLREWRGLLGAGGWEDQAGRNSTLLAILGGLPPPRKGERALGEGGDTAPSVSEAPLGQLGRYRFRRKLGAGASGVVYLASDGESDRLVAVKILRPELAASVLALARFEREARLAASVTHEHLVAVLDVGSLSGHPLPFLALEYVAGGSIADRLRREGTLLPREAADIARQAALGLACAHRRGLVHRDVKPSNILWDSESGVAKVGDFGVARVEAASDETTNGRYTRSGEIVGTPSYMSPEQVVTPERVDARSDVYGLGTALYQMLTGEPPFRGEPHAVIRQVIDRDPIPPRLLNERVPRDLETIVLKCIEKAPGRRYQRAEELAEDLGRWLSGTSILARRDPLPVRAARWSRKRPAAAALVVVSVLAVASVLSTILLYSSHLRETNAKLRLSLGQRERALRIAERQKEEKDTGLHVLGIEKAVELRGRSFSETMGALDRVPPSRRGWEWDRLAAQLLSGPRPTEIIGTHEWGVTATLLSGDGSTLVTSGQDGRVIRWDLPGGSQRELEGGTWLEGERRWRHALAPLPDGTRQDYVTGLCWVDGGRAVAGVSAMGRVVTWDLATAARHQIASHENPLLAVASSPEGGRLLLGDDRGSLLLLGRRGEGVTRFAGVGGSAILHIVRAGRNGWAIGQADGTVSLVDPGATRVLSRAKVSAPVWDLDVTQDGGFITVACGEAALRTFTVAEDARLRPAEAVPLPDNRTDSPRALHAVRISPDARSVCGADDLGRLMLWDKGEREPRFVRADQWASRPEADAVGQLPLPHRRRVTGIAFAPDGASLYTAGLDTTIKRWTLKGDGGVTQFDVGAEPRCLFDESEPALLWAGTADGSLAAWDSRTGSLRSTVRAHAGRVTGLAIVPRRSTVVSCGDDGTIRFWRQTGGRIQPNGTALRHRHPLRSVALSPDGRRVAAYDRADAVVVWDAASGGLLKTISMRKAGPDPAVGGLVAFNATGELLAAEGPGQSLWVIATDTLDVISETGIVAGGGGTALAWAPRITDRIVAGDTAGRINSFPAGGEPFLASGAKPGYLVGLCFTPDGSRLASVLRDGSVFVFDPRWAGRVLTLRCDAPEPTGVLFDPTGGRLAVSYRGGLVRIWETAPAAPGAGAVSVRRWSETVLLHGERARRLDLRPPAAVFDGRGRLRMLYTKHVTGDGESSRQAVCLGWPAERGFKECTLDTAADRDGPPFDPRSLAMLVDGETLFTAYRRRTTGYNGQMILAGHGIRALDSSDDASGDDPQVPHFEAGEGGFFTHLLPDRGDRPLALHFSHNGHYLLRTRRSGSGWETTRVGRQGDGMNFHAASGGDGQYHVVFSPNRFGGDRSPLVYLSGEGATREVVDASVDAPEDLTVSDQSVAVTPDGTPTLLLSRTGNRGTPELVFAFRAPSGWATKRALDGVPFSWSNLACDRRGRLRFAFTGPLGRRVFLATSTDNGGRWEIERVWEDPQLDDFLSEEPRRITLILLVDKDDQPGLLAVRRSAEHGWLRLFRPASGGSR